MVSLNGVLWVAVLFCSTWAVWDSNGAIIMINTLCMMCLVQWAALRSYSWKATTLLSLFCVRMRMYTVHLNNIVCYKMVLLIYAFLVSQSMHEHHYENIVDITWFYYAFMYVVKISNEKLVDARWCLHALRCDVIASRCRIMLHSLFVQIYLAKWNVVSSICCSNKSIDLSSTISDTLIKVADIYRNGCVSCLCLESELHLWMFS